MVIRHTAARAALEAGDFETAVSLLQKAADAGDAPACFYLGLCYRNGWGVGQDLGKAADYFLKAAEQGLDGAQYELGAMYHLGTGVEKDLEAAAEWYQKSLDAGYYSMAMIRRQ